VLGLAVMAGFILVPAAVWNFRWPIAVVCAAAFAAVFWADARQMELQLKQAHVERAESEAKRAHAAADYLKALRARDAAHVLNVAAMAAQHAREQTDAERTMDDLRRQLRAGDLRLRARFQCAPAPAAGGLPDAGAGPAAGGADGAAHTGLDAADAEFLVRIAADGDAAIRERNLAVAVAEQYRAACSAPASVMP
jgi:hypothetical protein